MKANLPAGAKKFEFKGTAKEWFGIWIVNLLLSIITLGIYSAWAKVRRKKYFYNNTFAEDRNFDYHATGKQIFIGRLIVLAGVIIFQGLSMLNPFLGLALTLVFLAALPWLIVRSIMFNARMSSFSNVRFNFVGTAFRGSLYFILYPILTALTLYLTFPLLDRAVNRFTINNHKLGTASFEMKAPIWPFYKAFLAALVWIVVAGVIGVQVTGFSFSMFAQGLESGESDSASMAKAIGLFYFLIFTAFLPAMFIYRAFVRNTIYNATTLEGGHQFVSSVSALHLFWIALSNMVVVICTLFLMLPWAHIRMAKYLANNTGFIPGSSLDDFVGTQQAKTSALGDAYTDLEAIDIGLPI